MKKNRCRSRIERFFDDLRADLTSYEIAAGLDNGDIDAPEWMGISVSHDHIKAWDNEEGGSDQMGFVTISWEA